MSLVNPERNDPTEWVHDVVSQNMRDSVKASEADNVVSNKKTDDEISPSTVTPSHSEGLLRWAQRCFAAAQHDNSATPTASPGCHPERSEGSVALGVEMLRSGSA